MEDIELKSIWKTMNKNLEDAKTLNLKSWELNLKTFEHLQNHKAHSKLKLLTSIKKWTVVLGILWVFVLGILVYGNHFKNLYFTFSLVMLMSFSIAAIVAYTKHIILIQKINFSESVVEAQKKLTKLQASTIKINRLLWLQMPFYTTLFWSSNWITSDYTFWFTAFPITVVFSVLAIWLYKNITLENVDKKWFKLLLNKEWSTVSSAKKYLNEIETFKIDQ